MNFTTIQKQHLVTNAIGVATLVFVTNKFGFQSSTKGALISGLIAGVASSVFLGYLYKQGEKPKQK